MVERAPRAPRTIAGSRVARLIVAPALALLGLTTINVLPGHAEATAVAPAAKPTETATKVVARATKLTLSITQSAPGTATLTGRLTAVDGTPIAGPVIVGMDGLTLGTVSSGGDGVFSAQVPGLSPGAHLASAVFLGSTARGPSSIMQAFQIATPPSAPAAPPPPAVAGAASVLTAKVSPSTATTGGFIDVSGTLTTSANAPINQARIEVATSWGGVTGAAATGTTGAFSVSLGLPALGEGPTPPSSLTITITYAGDSVYPATTATYRVGLKAPGPTPAPPSIASDTPAPPVAKPGASASPATTTGFADLDAGGAASRGLAILVFVLAVGAVTALAGMGAIAWRRNSLMPGERRGFGTDFGK